MTDSASFFASFNLPTKMGLLLNVGAAVGAVLLMNGLIFWLEWDTPAPTATSSLVPGYLVGIVWTGLFALLGVARWRLTAVPLAAGRSARRWVVVLAISCLLYPLYALALDSTLGGLLGNLETILLTAFVAWRVWPASRSAAGLVLPIIPWVVFATSTILQQLGK